MEHGFDKAYWEDHWETNGREGRPEIAPNPYLARETHQLVPGSALDAGCGEGAEAIWLAAAGWQVTAADISARALRNASERARKKGTPATNLRWVEADLGVWEPEGKFDLVTTNYAHPEMPQLLFYQRISDWVAPGGTLLVVGHLHRPDGAGHGHQQDDHGTAHRPPAEASVTAAAVTASFDLARWEVVTAQENTRTVAVPEGSAVQLHDVVVRAIRRP